ncbi:hypothetical protein SteCoe_26638 [Stentor coeruleus]|uniref:Globin family profile domain-containing protein n=1 Tax=Stentor coeruleus TaxID=5963 RepID=A0A1R2BCB9_9CILI|nr:hypothetical protein SteCoe_26638 [Stentor coeruleus]
MNIFQKYGGMEFWRDILSDFYSRIASSEKIYHHFIGVDIDNIKIMLVAMLEITLGSEDNSYIDSLKEIHKDKGISHEEFDEWILIYTKTLKDVGISKLDIDHIVETTETFRAFIVSKN